MKALIYILNILLTTVEVLIFIRIIMSWVMPYQYGRQNEFQNFIYQATEPILAPFRFVIKIGNGGVDLSALIAILIIDIIKRIII